MQCVDILLTKHEGRTGRISAWGLDSLDRAQRGVYKKDQGRIFSQYSPKQAWLIRLGIYYTTEIVLQKNPNDRLQRHHKLQAHNFYLEQTERLPTMFSKRRKTKLEENKNNILWGVNTFRKKSKTKRKTSCGIIQDSAGPILREYWTGNWAIWLADFSYWPSELT